MIDLEAFGVYQPPRLALSPIAQELALEALSQPALADFVLVCSDRRRLGCSRRILEDRWPWLRERLAKLQGSYLRGGSESEEDDELEMRKRLKGMTLLPRVTARSCELEEDSAVVLPALRYFYTCVCSIFVLYRRETSSDCTGSLCLLGVRVRFLATRE